MLTFTLRWYFEMVWTQFSMVHCTLEYYEYVQTNAVTLSVFRSQVVSSEGRTENGSNLLLGLSQHKSQMRALCINCQGAEERLPSSWCWQNKLEGNLKWCYHWSVEKPRLWVARKQWYWILCITNYMFVTYWESSDTKEQHCL